MRGSFQHARRAVCLVPLVTALLATGCVLPGGLTPVGGQQVNGRLRDASGNGLPDQRVVLVQGHFKRLDRESWHYTLPPVDQGKLERVELMTDEQGRFSHRLRGFTHCHPVWILPPLGTLPSKMTGEAYHGRFLIVRTPGLTGRVYEVRLRGDKARVRLFDTGRQRLRRIDPAGDPERVSARVDRIGPDDDSPGPRPVERVELEIARQE